MKIPIRIALFPVLVLTTTALGAQQAGEMDHANCPMHSASHAQPDAHHDVVEHHGDQAMGFPHDKTTHHFLLSAAGGIIQVTADDPNDATDIDAIRMHLTHIASMFAAGDFSTPMFVHDEIPPGVTAMKLLSDRIHYRFESLGSGGSVRIESSDAVALAAIHDFLRFQITEHRTGDPTSIPDAQ